MNRSFFLVAFSLLLITRCLSVLGGGALVTKYYTTVEKKGHTVESKVFVQILISNKMGDAYSEVDLSFSPINKLKGLSGRITDINGKTIRKLQKKDIETTSAFIRGIYHSDQMVKRFVLRHNVYPYIVEFEYTLGRESYLSVENWSPIYQNSISTLDGRLYYKIDNDDSVKFYNENCNYRKSTIDGEEFHEWYSNYLADNKSEYFSDVAGDQAFVCITTPSFKYVIEGRTENLSSPIIRLQVKHCFYATF